MSKSLFGTLSRYRPTSSGLMLEDFFTEVWAYVLRHNRGLLEDVVRVLAPSFPIDDVVVATQQSYSAADLPGSSLACRPDLVLRAGSAELICEHKIDAIQHVEETIGDDGFVASYSQLERYLALPSRPLVAFISLGVQQLTTSVLESERYRRPDGAHHFLWSDLHPIVAAHAVGKDADPFLRELRMFMDDLAMCPPREGVGIIPAANRPNMKAERRVLSRSWTPAIALLDANGWETHKVSLEIQLWRDQQQFPSLLFDMRYGEQEGLVDGVLKGRIRVPEGDAGAFDLLARNLRQAGFNVQTKRSQAAVAGNRIRCVDVICTTRETRPEWVGDSTLDARLLDFVAAVLRPIHDALGLPAFIG